jgi:uncharacterized protein
MQYISFEWDDNKNIRNKKVHGISFEEAQTSFYDKYARFIPDILHSEQEERFLLLGYSSKARLLTVCHCYRKNDDIIRIISARKASKFETEQYYHFQGSQL